MSTSMMPDQAAALAQLVKDTGAVACDIAPDDHWSLRVVTYHAHENRDPRVPPADARWWSISVAGTVREVAPTLEQVPA